ncbi:MAG TPA: hypothetical protein VFH73_04210, partial [Polyangia bacterium]|nr:hypothetical protein [Polyangia bacterium]
ITATVTTIASENKRARFMDDLRPQSTSAAVTVSPNPHRREDPNINNVSCDGVYFVNALRRTGGSLGLCVLVGESRVDQVCVRDPNRVASGYVSGETISSDTLGRIEPLRYRVSVSDGGSGGVGYVLQAWTQANESAYLWIQQNVQAEAPEKGTVHGDLAAVGRLGKTPSSTKLPPTDAGTLVEH